MTLHCPATLLVAPTPAREGGLHPLVEEVRGERVMAVVTEPDDARGAELAERLGVPHEVDPVLAEVADRRALSGVADLHRGETVLVLTRAAEGVGAVDEVVRVELGDG